jgi:plastocyanin
LAGVSQGDRVIVTAGRCKAKGRRLIAVRVTLAAKPSSGTVLELKADARGMPKLQASSFRRTAPRVVTATLKPGTYTYLCPVPGHAQAGMRGTLVVK